jgi:hypothetical protein
VIEVGQPYLYWEFQYGPKRVRCTKVECAPKPQDLTQSEYMIRAYELDDELQLILNREVSSKDDAQTVASDLEAFADTIDEFAQEQRDKLDNMPEGLQQGNAGQLLEQRAGALEDSANEIRDAAQQLNDTEDPEEGEDAERHWADAVMESCSISLNYE